MIITQVCGNGMVSGSVFYRDSVRPVTSCIHADHPRVLVHPGVRERMWEHSEKHKTLEQALEKLHELEGIFARHLANHSGGAVEVVSDEARVEEMLLAGMSIHDARNSFDPPMHHSSAKRIARKIGVAALAKAWDMAPDAVAKEIGADGGAVA